MSNTLVKIWVDNAKSVFIWKKDYSSSCLLSSTLVKALSTLADDLGCHVGLEKITWFSTPLVDMADALSECPFARFWDIAALADYFVLPLEPAWIIKFPSLPGFKTQFQMTAWVIRSSRSWLRGLWYWASTVLDVLRMVRVVLDSALPIMGFTFLLYLGLPMFQGGTGFYLLPLPLF